jgi:4-alpha-glucanotransferase
MIPRKLTRLARLYGVQTSYEDMRHETQTASPESLLAVLQVLGANVGGMDDVNAALQAREQQLWRRPVQPVIVAWDGKAPPVRIRAEASEGGSLTYSIRADSDYRLNVASMRLAALPVKKRKTVGSAPYVERELRITQEFPRGYHRIRFELKGGSYETLLISAPRQAYFPFERKVWGVFAPIYALHSRRTANAGDLKDFESLLKWANSSGASLAGTLPLLASYMDEPFEPSPYAPASRLFWNEFYIDGGDAGGRQSRRADSGLVDYRSEMRLRRKILQQQCDAFFRSERAEGRDRFADFVRSEPEVESYARFRAVTEQRGKGWTSWPAALQNGRIRPADYDANVERYHLYVQWRLQEQLGTLARETHRNDELLYLDLPLGLHPDSFDVWRFPELFVRQAAGGAPPDPVFSKGQNWGFPPMHPEAIRQHHHNYTVAYVRNHLRYARMLRIDHVMGLHRLFWIPNGLTGDKGVYVEYPAEELYAILCLESHRNLAGIVGENLGTVPPQVIAAMERHNIQQMYVLQYEAVGDDPAHALRAVPSNAVASLNTHDMPPFRAFLDATDIDERLDLGFLDEKSARTERRQRAAIRKLLVQFFRQKKLLPRGAGNDAAAIFKGAAKFLAASMAAVVLINVEDLWGETLPQNIPATHRERPNWSRRMKPSIEEIVKSSELKETMLEIGSLRAVDAPDR